MTTPSPPAPGRLTVREQLDRIEIALPLELHAAKILYGAIVGMAALGTLGVALVERPGLVGVVEGLLVVGVAGAVFWAVGRLLGRFLRWTAHNRRASMSIVTLLAAGFVLGFLNSVEALNALVVGASLFSGFVYAALFVWLSGGGATLSLDQNKLELRRRKQRWSRPLEGIKTIERGSGFFSPIQVDGELMPGASALDDSELAWLRERILVEADRRRAELVAAGVDPESEAAPPEALLSQLDRARR